MAHKRKRPDTYELQVGERGRVVLPVRVRRRLHLHSGDRLVLTLDESGEMRLASLKCQIAKCRGIFSHVAPERVLSDELITERRAEANREERD